MGKNRIIPNINHVIPSRDRAGTGPQGTVVSAFLLCWKVFSIKCGGQSRKVIRRSVVWKGRSDHQIGKWKPLTVAGVRMWSSCLERPYTAPGKALAKTALSTLWHSKYPPRSRRSPYTCIPQGIDKNVCSSLIHRSPELETTQ